MPGVSTTIVGSPVAGDSRGQRAGQAADVGVDGLDAVVTEQLGEDVLGDHPVLEQVRDARRDPQVVLQHVPEAPVVVADEVAAADVGPDAARWVDAHALAAGSWAIPRPGRPGPRRR